MTKKKKDKRGKYPGLDPKVHPRTRAEYIDFDYASKLSPKDKEWLSNFSEEHYGGNFHHKGKKLTKSVQKKREAYNNNNRRNRDILSISRSVGWVSNIDDNTENIDKIHNTNFKRTENITTSIVGVKDAIKKTAVLAVTKKK